jgi:phage tail sheath protein FI
MKRRSAINLLMVIGTAVAVGIKPLKEGTIIWGKKTLLSKPSAFDRVNARRLILEIERALTNYSKFFLFEPNNKRTRKRFSSGFKPYLEKKKDEYITEYLFVCDETNNTPDVIDNNELVCDIYIREKRTFIKLNFIAGPKEIKWT